MNTVQLEHSNIDVCFTYVRFFDYQCYFVCFTKVGHQHGSTWRSRGGASSRKMPSARAYRSTDPVDIRLEACWVRNNRLINHYILTA